MIEIKFNLSKLNGSKWINWVKSMWMKYELGVNKGKTKSDKRKYICKTNIKEIYL